MSDIVHVEGRRKGYQNITIGCHFKRQGRGRGGCYWEQWKRNQKGTEKVI